MLKDQAHHVHLATADVYIGDDMPAQRLQQQLQDWWRQMHQLAAKYQNLQGTFSNMLHGQTAVIRKLQDLVTTLLSNVELAQQLASCRSKEPGQEEMCRNNTAGLLQDCLDAITKARASLSDRKMRKQCKSSTSIWCLGWLMRRKAWKGSARQLPSSTRSPLVMCRMHSILLHLHNALLMLHLQLSCQQV
jgi:hypothetical protein